MGIEPGQSVCGERLTGTTVGPVTVEGQASHLLVVLGWLASGDKPPVHAGVVSRIGQDLSDLAPPAPARVLRLELTTATPLREALDHLVRENAGGVWIVWQHALPEGGTGCRLMAYLPDKMVVASRRDFAVAR